MDIERVVTTLDRVTELARQTELAKNEFSDQEHQILWDALVDAHAALAAAETVVRAVIEFS